MDTFTIICFLIIAFVVVCSTSRFFKKGKNRPDNFLQNYQVGKSILKKIGDKKRKIKSNPFYKIQKQKNKITGETKFKVMILQYHSLHLDSPLIESSDMISLRFKKGGSFEEERHEN